MRPLTCLGRIFPMDDAVSARLAIVKAECLGAAGVISRAEKAAVIERAMVVIDQAQACQAAGHCLLRPDVFVSHVTHHHRGRAALDRTREAAT